MKLFDVIETGEVQELCESFTALTGAVTAVSDLDGTILVSADRPNPCTGFHRENPTCAQQCKTSLAQMAERLRSGERTVLFQCPNGLSEVGIPIVVGGEHVANIVSGQFLTAPPDTESFARRAEAVGLDKIAYLASLEGIPVFSEEKVRKIAEFLVKGARIIGELGTTLGLLEERKEHIRFLENLELIDWTIKRETDVEKMLWHIVKTVFTIFNCDRAWLFYPCDPSSPTFRVPVEITRPEYPGASELNIDVPMPPDMALNLRDALASDAPVVFVAGTNEPINSLTAERFGVQSQMFMAIYPRVGSPWVFGMHQCAYPREWTREERRLFQEIGGRLADGLSTLLMFRDLRQSEARYRRIVDTANEGVWVLDPDGRTAFVNAQMARIIGCTCDELQGRPISDFLFPEDLPDHLKKMEVYRQGEAGHFERRFCHMNGQTVWTMASVVPILDDNSNFTGFFGMFTDVTERHHLASRLLQSQKMEAIGRLAGGVAHDFNNMLGVIIGNADMALEEVPSSQSLFVSLSEIHKAASHAADLTRKLLTFARKQTASPRILDLNGTVTETLGMLRKLIGEDIEVVWQPGEEVGKVLMDPTQLDQVLFNLCINARDAIMTGGRITIRTGTRTLDADGSARLPGMVPGKYANLSICDTGAGMLPAVQAKIFEPFFTTKGAGKGTGLGLATVWGIVAQNGGFIEFESEPGTGTTFQVFLPAHRQEATPDEGESTDPVFGGETILLVEDEVQLLMLTRRLLERLGYNVLVADGPLGALERAREYPGVIDLLMTDVVMPGMSGPALRDELVASRPGLKSLFVSGHTPEMIARYKIPLEVGAFLPKPYSLQSLSEKLREVLARSMPNSSTR